MTWLEKRLAERIKSGGLKIAFEPFNRLDREEWCSTITTTCGQFGKCSTIVIFEYEK